MNALGTYCYYLYALGTRGNKSAKSRTLFGGLSFINCEGKKEVHDYRVKVQTLSPKVASNLGWEEIMGRGDLRLAATQKKIQHAWSPDYLQQNHETYNATPIRQAGRQVSRHDFHGIGMIQGGKESWKALVSCSWVALKCGAP